MRRLTVLGSCGAFPEPGRACSGFLLEWDGFRVVLDLGYATLPRLLAHCPDAAIDAVVVTHEHPDHCVDLHGLFRIRHYGGHSGGHSGTVPLYCPPGVPDRLAGLEPDVDLRDVFDIHELPGAYRVGPFALAGVALPHFVPNVGVRLTAGDTVVAYTGDTGPDPALVELARDADVFVAEATDRPGERERPSRNLLCPDEAGRFARQAGARRLLLTHFWPGNDRAAAADAARATFGGDVLVATEDLIVELGRGPAIGDEQPVRRNGGETDEHVEHDHRDDNDSSD